MKQINHHRFWSYYGVLLEEETLVCRIPSEEMCLVSFMLRQRLNNVRMASLTSVSSATAVQLEGSLISKRDEEQHRWQAIRRRSASLKSDGEPVVLSIVQNRPAGQVEYSSPQFAHIYISACVTVWWLFWMEKGVHVRICMAAMQRGTRQIM